MISVQEATSIILSHLWTPKTERVELSSAVGRTLAEPILADRDFPPFNRVSMDGIAISAKAFQSGRSQFEIEGIQAAGIPPLKFRIT